MNRGELPYVSGAKVPSYYFVVKVGLSENDGRVASRALKSRATTSCAIDPTWFDSLNFVSGAKVPSYYFVCVP